MVDCLSQCSQYFSGRGQWSSERRYWSQFANEEVIVSALQWGHNESPWRTPMTRKSLESEVLEWPSIAAQHAISINSECPNIPPVFAATREAAGNCWPLHFGGRLQDVLMRLSVSLGYLHVRWRTLTRVWRRRTLCAVTHHGTCSLPAAVASFTTSPAGCFNYWSACCLN